MHFVILLFFSGYGIIFKSAYRGIAQLVEQRSPKPRVERSSRSTPAIKNETHTVCLIFYIPVHSPRWTQASAAKPPMRKGALRSPNADLRLTARPAFQSRQRGEFRSPMVDYQHTETRISTLFPKKKCRFGTFFYLFRCQIGTFRISVKAPNPRLSSLSGPHFPFILTIPVIFTISPAPTVSTMSPSRVLSSIHRAILSNPPR